MQIDSQDEGEESSWQIENVLPIKSLPFGQPATTYVLLGMPEDGRITGSFNATLKFKVRDVDPATGEPESNDHYDDIYAVLFLILLGHLQKSQNYI